MGVSHPRSDQEILASTRQSIVEIKRAVFEIRQITRDSLHVIVDVDRTITETAL